MTTPAESISSFDTGRPHRTTAPESGRPGMILGNALPPAIMPMTRAAIAAAEAARVRRTALLMAAFSAR